MRTRAQQDLSTVHSLRSVQELAEKEAALPVVAARPSTTTPSSDSDSDYDAEQYQLAQRLRVALGYAQPRATVSTPVEDAASSSEDDEEGASLRWRPQQGQLAEDPEGTALQPALQDYSKQLELGSRDGRAEQLQARKAAAKTAGRQWFDLPAPQMTKETETDLRLLGLRGLLERDRFYKRPDSKKLPTYFQMGTVIEGAAEFYSGRLTRRERQPTLTQEVVADPDLARQRKRRYHRLQEEREAHHGRTRKKKLHPRKASRPKSRSGQ